MKELMSYWPIGCLLLFGIWLLGVYDVMISVQKRRKLAERRRKDTLDNKRLNAIIAWRFYKWRKRVFHRKDKKKG